MSEDERGGGECKTSSGELSVGMGSGLSNGTRLDRRGGCKAGDSNNGWAISNRGDIISSSPSPPPCPRSNCSMILCISDCELSAVPSLLPSYLAVYSAASASSEFLPLKFPGDEGLFVRLGTSLVERYLLSFGGGGGGEGERTGAFPAAISEGSDLGIALDTEVSIAN